MSISPISRASSANEIKEGFVFLKKNKSFDSLSSSDSGWLTTRSSDSGFSDHGLTDSGLEKLTEERRKTNSSNRDVSGDPDAFKHFYDLELTDLFKEKIQNLVKKLAETNVLELGLRYSEMNLAGKEIKEGVHPMRFIGHVLTDQDSCKNFKAVKENSLKYIPFLKGFTDHMKEKAVNEDLGLYVPGFAKHVGVSSGTIAQAIQNRQYKDLIEKCLSQNDPS